MEDARCLTNDPRLVGDPVDTLTGAVVDSMLDFRLTGPLELRWSRYYDSSRCGESFSVGRGCAHEFDRSLTIDADGLEYEEAVRRVLRFPTLLNDGDEWAGQGYCLRRISSGHYILSAHAQPTMEFVFHTGAARARLSRLLRGGAEVRFHYDNDGRLIRIDDSAGRTLRAREDEAFRLVELSVDATATTSGYLLIAYEYDDHGNLIRTTDTYGHGYTFEYDEHHRVVLRRGRKGFQFYYRYDEQGRCVVSMGDGRLYGVALDYAIPGRLTRVTHPDRGVWTYTFSPQGGLASIADPLGGVQKFVCDPVSNLPMQEVDPNGNPQQYVYNAAGAAVAKLDPFGRSTTLPEDVNAPDPLLHRVAANAAEYTYGRLLNTARTTLPDEQHLREIDLSDDIARLVSIRSQPDDPGARFKVPPLRVLWWPNPVRGRIFNDLGKLIAQQDEQGRLRRWTYDASGNVATYMDFDGGMWSYDYGAYHFLEGLTNPAGNEARSTHTAHGAVASFTDAGGATTEFGYDQKKCLVEIRRHGVVRESYTRDACGNLIAKHAGDGRELLRFEIRHGNLPASRVLASGDVHRFEYDASGRIRSATTLRDRLEFAYDSLGNRTRDQRNGLGVTHRHQGFRRPVETCLLERFIVRYSWQGHVLTITDPGGRAHTIHFLGHGLVQHHFSNGTHESAQYDGQGRCQFKQARFATGPVWTRRYHWSGEGTLLKSEDNLYGDQEFEYDAAHRLRQRTVQGRTESYLIDAADNLLSQPGLESVQLTQGNRLATADHTTFAYNDRNHIESRCTPAGTTRYGYDARDQLTSVKTPKVTFEAEYDPLGRRTRKRWDGKATEYYWSSDQLIAEVRDDGSLRLYIYADLLSLTPLLILDYARVSAPLDSGLRYFIFTDQIGTPCRIENDRGDEVWRAQIGPFGRADIAAGAKIQFDMRFPGHYLDGEIGLHYNRFRYYDPALGRYLQSDPWGLAGGANLYAYRTNPLGAVDVRGLGEEGEEKGPPAGEGGEDEESSSAAAANEEGPRRLTREEGQAVVDEIHGSIPDEKARKLSVTTLSETEDGTLIVTNSKQKGAIRQQMVAKTAEMQEPGGPLEGQNVRAGGNTRGSDDYIPPGQRDLANAPNPARASDGEQRGVQAANVYDSGENGNGSVTRQWSSGDAEHGGAACTDCETVQRQNGITNETGYQSQGGRYDRGGTEPAWNGAPPDSE